MSGHSKWATTKHRKAGQDAKKAKIFNKLAREITVAAKGGLPDPDHNSTLRNAIINARSQSMPNDRIKKAIDVAIGNADGANYEEIRYEGYGPGGVAVIVEALTDNRNRTAGEVRTAFAKNGGNLGETNSVSFMFDKIGYITYPISVAGEDAMFEKVIEAGAENVEVEDGMYGITTTPESFLNVRDALVKQLGNPQSSEIIWNPKTETMIDYDQAQTLLRLIDVLEDSDDVQKVFTNFEVSEEDMAKLSA